MKQKFITNIELKDNFSFVGQNYSYKKDFYDFDKFLFSNKELFKIYKDLVNKSYTLFNKNPSSIERLEINRNINEIIDYQWSKFQEFKKSKTIINKINKLMNKSYVLFPNSLYVDVEDKDFNITKGIVNIRGVRADNLSYYYDTKKVKQYVNKIFNNFKEVNVITYGIKVYKR